MKVNELEGAELDYWVAKAAEPRWVELRRTKAWLLDDDPRDGIDIPYRPSSWWQHGGPLIEEYGLTVSTHVSENGVITSWKAYGSWPAKGRPEVLGASPLEAACRAIVASVYGEEVPDAPGSE